MKWVAFYILIFCVVAVILVISPAHAQTTTPQPIVRAIMFWMDGCPHCHYVLDNVLPPLQAKYGEQLQIELIELVGGDEVVALYRLAESMGIPKEQVGVPFLIIGDHALLGSEQIPAELPGLIDSYLASGGVHWPEIPELGIFPPSLTPLPSPSPSPSPQPETPTPTPQKTKQTPSTPSPVSSKSAATATVRGVLFNSPDCYDCRAILTQAINPARQKYGDQFELRTINVITFEDVEYLYQVAATLGLQKEQVDLPLLILGDSVLIGEQITADLPELVERHLEANGSEYPVLPTRFVSPTQTPSPTPLVIPAPVSRPAPSGFSLAVAVMVFMLAALIYTSIAFLRRLQGLPGPQPVHLGQYEWLIPLLSLLGLGVAGYLAYVETQAVRAICGPVGDCNAVQSSPYARLFGVLSVGVLGLVGYLLILVAWLIQRAVDGKPAAWAALALFGMAYGGTLFSLYLTFLEPFVIRAVCAWCLASAVIMALLLVCSLDVAVQQTKPGGIRDKQNKA